MAEGIDGPITMAYSTKYKLISWLGRKHFFTRKKKWKKLQIWIKSIPEHHDTPEVKIVYKMITGKTQD